MTEDGAPRAIPLPTGSSSHAGSARLMRDSRIPDLIAFAVRIRGIDAARTLGPNGRLLHPR